MITRQGLLGSEPSKAEFAVFDKVDESMTDWMHERGIDCDYSRSRGDVYIGGDRVVEDLVLISIDGIVLNLSEDDFDKFKKALNLTENTWGWHDPSELTRDEQQQSDLATMRGEIDGIKRDPV